MNRILSGIQQNSSLSFVIGLSISNLYAQRAICFPPASCTILLIPDKYYFPYSQAELLSDDASQYIVLPLAQINLFLAHNIKAHIQALHILNFLYYLLQPYLYLFFHSSVNNPLVHRYSFSGFLSTIAR